MSKRPADLSADLVAINGTATPAPDMHGRIAPKPAPEVKEELTPLNFRIPASFRREFKTYAATHDLKLNELLRRCFDAYRNQH